MYDNATTLTSIHKRVLSETLTQAHSLNPHVFENVLDRFWHVGNGTGSGLAIGHGRHATHLKFKSTVDGLPFSVGFFSFQEISHNTLTLNA